ncbi:MAG TPA: methyltransferase domain-containing protein, partial [Candidatus Sulfotelmatobacter sp.]|nr:methyltransferase domain-containing protein [Candidatus Sulfotelmatobacter sp.]
DEALAHLRGLADSSLAAITAFQVAEHVDNRSLMALIDQALRVLRPQGLLLLETPNPRNLVVGATTFWIDPTHVRPLPPDLLSFLLEERGFGEVHVVYGARPPVEEFAFIDNDTADQQKLNRLIGFINETFFGAQDYAVIGRKPST